jgi:hypothetical protein
VGNAPTSAGNLSHVELEELAEFALVIVGSRTFHQANTM